MERHSDFLLVSHSALHHSDSVLLERNGVAFALLGEPEYHLRELFSPGVIISVRP